MTKEEKVQVSSVLNSFVLTYYRYINTPRDYGSGELLNSVEAHVLNHIYDHPGITVTELAKAWNRTKGAISQTVSRLEAKQHITRIKENGDAKTIHLYCTEKGSLFTQAHKEYDNRVLDFMMDKMNSYFPEQDIKAMVRVLSKLEELTAQRERSETDN